MKTKHHLQAYFIGALCLLGSLSTATAALIVNPAASSITQMVNIQPIIVSDNDGSNAAEYFGDSTQQSAIESLIDTIWAQAGIDINFLSSNFWNNTFANEGTSDPRSTSDLNAIVNSATTAGITNPDSTVINIFFVNIVPGFSPLGDNSAAGLAFVDGNGITQYIGSNLLGFANGLDVIASVVSHEIGHNLGLGHLSEVENLMQFGGATDQGERLNANQVSIALASEFSVAITPVPVPPALVLFLSGLGLLGFARHKRA